MVATVLLVGLLLVATYTDVRWRKIFNWTTYPGVLLALSSSGLATLLGVQSGGERQVDFVLSGLTPFSDSVGGLLCCGAAMLVCYVFFPGGVGGGDVKLIAMMGAFLGVQAGLEAMLWTFVLGGCAALIVVVWRVGLWNLAVDGGRYVWRALRLGRPLPLAPEARKPLQTSLFLAPSALAALVLVHYRLALW